MKAFAVAATALAATFALALAATDTAPTDAVDEIAATAERVAEEI